MKVSIAFAAVCLLSLAAVVVNSSAADKKDDDEQRLLGLLPPLGHRHGRHVGGAHQRTAYRFLDNTLDASTSSTTTTAAAPTVKPPPPPPSPPGGRPHKKKHHKSFGRKKSAKQHEASSKMSKDYDSISGEFNCSLFNGRGCETCQAHASCIFMRCADIGSSFCSHKKIRHALEMHMPGLESCRLVTKCPKAVLDSLPSDGAYPLTSEQQLSHVMGTLSKMRNELELNLARAKSNEERQALLEENSDKEQQFLNNFYQTHKASIATEKPPKVNDDDHEDEDEDDKVGGGVLPRDRTRLHPHRQQAHGAKGKHHNRHEPEPVDSEKVREEELEREEEAMEDFEDDDEEEDDDDDDDDDDFDDLDDDDDDEETEVPKGKKVRVDDDDLFEPLAPKVVKSDADHGRANGLPKKPFVSTLDKVSPRLHKDHGKGGEVANKANVWSHRHPVATGARNVQNSKDMQIATLGTVIGVLVCSLLVLGCMCYVAIKKINQISWKSTKASHTLLKPRALWRLHRMLYEHNRWAHDESDVELEENSLVPASASQSSSAGSVAIATSSEASSLSANDGFGSGPLPVDERGPIIKQHVHKHHYHHHHQHHLSSSRRFYH